MKPTEADSVSGEAARSARARRIRQPWALLFVALVVALVAAGIGGFAYASGRAQTAMDARQANDGHLPVITVYNTNDANAAHESKASPTPQPSPTPGAPQPCICEVHTLSRAVPPTPPPAPSQLVVVSLSQQWLWAYEGGQQVFDTPVTTGQPNLATPTGTFNIQQKLWDVMFYSPWPQGSPYYYSPEHVDFAMLFLSGGYFIHDAPWRHCFGPGTNVPHTCPDGTQETGSHGCVNMPYSAGQWLINWVRMGTTVRIEA